MEKYLIIKTYKELQKYVEAFVGKNIGLLIVVSRAGLGKTYLVEATLEAESPLTLNSHITPLRFYQILYDKTREEKDCFIIIDEAEMMFQNSKLKTMLKILCDTRKEKTIRYDTTSPVLKKGQYDECFETEAKVIMLINTLEPKDEHIRAIMSRGHLIKFDPTDLEILNYMKNWGNTDKEIMGFIQKFAGLSRGLSLRTYVKAVESKKSDLDWQGEVINELGLDQRLLIMKRLLDTCKTETERLKRWEEQTGNGRDSYFRFKKLYQRKVT
jgi:hypothetical protein